MKRPSVGVWPLVYRRRRTTSRDRRHPGVDNVIQQTRIRREAGICFAASVHQPSEQGRSCWGRSGKLLYRGPQPRGPESQRNSSRRPLRHFEVSILTQGAGCQIYSTTFVQWASRECLHRAQPLTLFARFATRQSNAPMEQLLARDPLMQPQDKAGSLTDAEMGAYYT
jgi:hypothetical protein